MNNSKIHKKPVIVGLLGGLGSGKTATAQIFKAYGFAIFDADATVHELLDTKQIQDQIKNTFGHSVINMHTNKIDKKKLAQIVFSCKGALKKLTDILHPLVIKRFEEFLQDAVDKFRGIVLDAPLLLEAGMDRFCTHLIFIDTPLQQRIKRASKRGITEQELLKRESFQLPLSEKRQRADLVIDNSADLASLRVQVKEFISKIVSDGTFNGGTYGKKRGN